MSYYVDQMFAARQVGAGGVVRRDVDDVLRMGVMEEILDVARAEGWHVIETGGQVVVLCHRGAMHIHC